MSNMLSSFLGTLSIKITSYSNTNVPQNDDQVVEDEYYNREVFVSAKCHCLNDCLAAKNITHERGSLLENLQARVARFYRRLVASGWICFANELIKENHLMVWEFYANAVEINFADDLVVMMQDK